MAVYWIGADNNAYYKGDDGQVHNYGPADLGSDENTLAFVGPNFDNLRISATRIDDPNPPAPTPSGSYAGGGTSDADAQAKADEQAYWTDQMSALQRLLGSTQTQKEQGLTRIEDTYQGSVGKTREQEAQGLRDYATKREDTTKGKLTAFGDIDTKARTGYEALMRVLGLGNAGVSSTARIVAPTAVSREATQQRNRTNETFGRNLRDIDTKEGDFKLQVANALTDLLSQKKGTTEDFLRGILSQEASLNEQLSQAATQKAIAGGENYRTAADNRAPFQQRIGDIQSTLDSLFGQFRAPRFQAAPISAQAPDLSEYIVDPIKVAAQRANPTIDQSLLPYLANLKRNEQDQLV